METVCTRSLTVWARLSIFPAPSLSDGLDGERLERAFSPAQNARHVAGQIDHRARLVQLGEQRVRVRMSRHPYADRLPARVRRAARHIRVRAQDEGIAAGRHELQHLEACIV